MSYYIDDFDWDTCADDYMTPKMEFSGCARLVCELDKFGVKGIDKDTDDAFCTAEEILDKMTVNASFVTLDCIGDDAVLYLDYSFFQDEDDYEVAFENAEEWAIEDMRDINEALKENGFVPSAKFGYVEMMKPELAYA